MHFFYSFIELVNDHNNFFMISVETQHSMKLIPYLQKKLLLMMGSRGVGETYDLQSIICLDAIMKNRGLEMNHVEEFICSGNFRQLATINIVATNVVIVLIILMRYTLAQDGANSLEIYNTIENEAMSSIMTHILVFFMRQMQSKVLYAKID